MIVNWKAVHVNVSMGFVSVNGVLHTGPLQAADDLTADDLTADLNIAPF